MNLLVRAAVILAAGVAGWMLAKRGKQEHTEAEAPRVVYLGDDEAVVDAERQPAPAQVRSCYRRMNPLTLQGANEAIFILDDGEEVKLNFDGDGGLYLKAGDRGMLTWRGMRLIRFEKENGDVIGGMFYAPAGEDANE